MFMRDSRETITYFVYVRKSSESEERQVQSIDDQIDSLTKLADEIGLTITDVLKEAKSSKCPGNRPVFSNMIERIERGEANGILCWQINRLSRNPIDSGRIQWLLQQGIIKSIQTINREYRPDDNALLLSVESGSANQYILDLKKGVKRGLQSKLKKGWMPATAPLGYLNTKTETRGENYIIKDSERFPLVRKAWDLLLTGTRTPDQILDKLNNEWGFKTRPWKRRGGKPMSRSTIYRIFTDPFYAGLFWYNGQLYEGKHPEMITLREFDYVQVLLGRKGRPRPKRHYYSYTGTFTCGECGGSVSATFKEKILKSTNELKQYTLYYCVNARKNKGACSQRHYTNVHVIEKQIAQEIEKFTILPEFKQWMLDILKKEDDEEVEKRTQIYKTQLKTLNDAQRQLDNLRKLRLRELIDDDEYIHDRKELKKEIVTLRQRVKETQSRADAWQEQTDRAFDFTCHAREAFGNGGLQTKKSILAAIGLNCTLKDNRIALQSPSWLVPIKRHCPGLEGRFKAFELGKKPYTERQKEAVASLRPEVRALRDDVGTAIRDYSDYLHIPDLKHVATA